MIRVSHLSKKYGDFTAVNDLSFHLDKGKIYGFLGPNGAGKSTTMNMITGYLAPDEGEIEIGGYDILQDPQKAKSCIGYLPEIPPLYIDLTVKEYLTCVAAMKKVPRGSIREEVERAMEKVEITDRKDRLIKNLSKGYRQRTGIAQAILADPPVIILDEPTVGLDPRQIMKIREVIHDLKEGHTVVFSSHILSEVSEICDEVLIINKGNLITSGSADKLEDMFSGEYRLHITAEGKEEKIREILSGFDMITDSKISRAGHGENGAVNAADLIGSAKSKVNGQAEDNINTGETARWELELKIDGRSDIRRELFYRFADEKCPILEMRREAHSLEEIFLSLTREAL